MVARRHLEGLWSAELTDGRTAASIGVLVFEPVRVTQGGGEEGRVQGGDRHYAHVGTYCVGNGRVSGRVRIVRYDVHEEGAPLFERDEVALEFEGTLDPDGRSELLELELTGPDPEVPGATGLRLALRVGS